MPYLIYSPKKQSVVFTSSTELATTPTTLTVSGVSMTGKYEPTMENGLFGIPAQQDRDILQAELIKTTGDKTFLPTRCGISFDGEGTPTIKHVTKLDDETAISTLQATNAKVDVYTVNGMLVKKNIGMNDAMNTLSHGIYVVNGQKFMVK